MSLFDRLKSWIGATPSNHGDREQSRGSEGTPPSSDEPGPNRAGARRVSRADDEQLEAEARSLFERGDAAGAITLLGERAMLFARHEPGSLPCLCKECLVVDLDTAESAGIQYQRDFVVARNRALFFWAPKELASDARQLRASMRSELRSRLIALRNGDDRSKVGTNPFTKEPITIPPKPERRKWVNPFTGKTIR